MQILFIVVSLTAVIYVGSNVLLGNSISPIIFEVQSFNDPALTNVANQKLTEAEAVRDALIGNFRWWKSAQEWTGLIALACTALATFLAGWTRARGGDQGKDFFNKKVTSIGLAAAIATVANMGYDQASDRAEAVKDYATEVSRALSETATELRALPDQEARILSDLDALVLLYK